MPLRRSTRMVILVLALVAIATVGGSADPFGPGGQAGRRWHHGSGPAEPPAASSTRTIGLAFSDHQGRRWR